MVSVPILDTFMLLTQVNWVPSESILEMENAMPLQPQKWK